MEETNPFITNPEANQALKQVVNFAAACMMEAASNYLINVRRMGAAQILARDAEVQAEFVRQLQFSFEPAWVECNKHSTDRTQQIIFFKKEMEAAGVRAVKKVFGFEVMA